jgi:hypothetical protein
VRPVSLPGGDSPFVRIDGPNPATVGRATSPSPRFDARPEAAAPPDALLDDPSRAVSASMRYMVSP